MKTFLLSVALFTVFHSSHSRDLGLYSNSGQPTPYVDSSNLKPLLNPTNWLLYPLKWPQIKYVFPYKVQSPINILTGKAQLTELTPLEIHFPWSSAEEMVSIENTGYYLEVLLPHKVKQRPFLTGGPLLDSKYVFEQLHFHWGPTDQCGSEHHMDGRWVVPFQWVLLYITCRATHVTFMNDGLPTLVVEEAKIWLKNYFCLPCFSTEVHLVYYNTAYGCFEESVNHPDGVAVLAIFGNISPEYNHDFDNLIKEFTKIIEPESKTNGSFNKEFKFLDILFKQPTYYSFPGSLTTPSYSECVTWIVVPVPFDISPQQLHVFRKLKAKDGKNLSDNDRPLQDFAGRPLITPCNDEKFCFTQEITFTKNTRSNSDITLK